MSPSGYIHFLVIHSLFSIFLFITMHFDAGYTRDLYQSALFKIPWGYRNTQRA